MKHLHSKLLGILKALFLTVSTQAVGADCSEVVELDPSKAVNAKLIDLYSKTLQAQIKVIDKDNVLKA